MSGLTFSNVELWIIGLTLVLSLVNLALVVFLFKKIKQLLGGTNAKNIEEALGQTKKELDRFEKFRSEINKYLQSVEKRLRRSVQSVETIRFNPFKGTGDGGNQSFSMSLVDENGDGAVVSSLYSRERISIFSKPIKNFNSEFELSEEERKVVGHSQGKIKN